MTPDLVPTPDDDLALALLPEQPSELEMEAFGHWLQSLEAEHGTVDLATRHVVNAGVYGRQIVLPAGVFLVGLRHRRPGLAVSVGDITVWTSAGRQRLTGAHVLPTEPGTLRIGYAHAETTWLTVHANPTGTADLAAIEDALVEHPERLQTRRLALEAA